MIEVRKDGDRIFLSISVELDKEDLIDLAGDLSRYAYSKLNHKSVPSGLPKFAGISDEDVKKSIAYTEAKAQNEAKNKLHKEMQRVFVDVFDTEYLETKFATVYKLDEINREVEILRKKLNKQ